MRPRVFSLAALVVLALAGGGLVAAETNAWGVTMPPDAAPLNQQFVRLLSFEGTTADFAVSVYKRVGNSYSSIMATPFFRIDKNFELQPVGVTSYETSKDGKTWTFHMDPKVKWSDGNPLNHHRLKSVGLRSSAKADWGRHHGSTLKSASWSRSGSC